MVKHGPRHALAMRRSADAPVPVVHVFYRYTAASNSKLRPEYFSKTLALDSFVDALSAVPGQVAVTFLVDGDISEEVLGCMESVGEVVFGVWQSNRKSYLAQLRLARRTRAQLVWFAEDDYLYAKDALSALVQAVRHLRDVDWFALSGPTPLEHLELRQAQSAVPLPPSASWPPAMDTDVALGRTWKRIDSTTSTFGGRPEAIRGVSWLLRLCPWSGAAWDRTTCLAIQGATPYPWRYVFRDLMPASTPRSRLLVRLLWRVATRVAVNVASLTQLRHGAVLVAPDEALIGHMDLPYEERPCLWDARADELAQRVQPRRPRGQVRREDSSRSNSR